MTAPVFSSTYPIYGSVAGGTAITITGTGFTGATSVTVGGVVATSLVVVSDTSITCVTPAGTVVGQANIVITTPGGTATGTNAFLYAVIPNFVNFAATVRSRLLAAAGSLGNLQQVLDRDEDPDIIASNTALLPTICVVPIGAGKLSGASFISSADQMEDFQQIIVGYYLFSQNNATPYFDINLMRQYAENARTLFTGQANMQFNSCVVYKTAIEIKPYEARDMMLDRWILTLFVKSVEL
jgi:uncharacterized protein (TIGR03437 family)